MQFVHCKFEVSRHGDDKLLRMGDLRMNDSKGSQWSVDAEHLVLLVKGWERARSTKTAI
jgi:hypothetical protein